MHIPHLKHKSDYNTAPNLRKCDLETAAIKPSNSNVDFLHENVCLNDKFTQFTELLGNCIRNSPIKRVGVSPFPKWFSKELIQPLIQKKVNVTRNELPSYSNLHSVQISIMSFMPWDVKTTHVFVIQNIFITLIDNSGLTVVSGATSNHPADPAAFQLLWSSEVLFSEFRGFSEVTCTLT